MHLDIRQKILALDDKPANLAVLRSLLSQFDAEVQEAMSGNDALALIWEHDFAVLLVDVDKPVMDGYEFVALALGVEKNQNTPIIFITAAFKDYEHRIKGYRVGAVDSIEKPIDPEVLTSKVRVFLELDQKRREIERLNDELAHRLEEQQKSEKRLNAIIQTTSEEFWLIHPDTKATIDVNEGLCRILGYGRDAMIGKTPFDFVDEENQKIFKEQTSKIPTTNHRSYDITLKRKSGRDVQPRFNATTLWDDQGRPEMAFAFVTAITERKQAEAVRDLPAFAYAGSIPRDGGRPRHLQADRPAAWRPHLGRVDAWRGQRLPFHSTDGSAR